MRLKINVALTACAVLLAPAAAWAQAGGASLGVRATGLGAFVAVADDASAVAWNPGGLAAGPIFNLLIDLGRVSDHPPPDRPAEGRGERVQSTLLAFGTLPLGLAYYRIRTAEVEAAPPADGSDPGRQDRGAVVRTLVTSHLGVTLQQSVGDYLTLGATLKLVRGSVGRAPAPAGTWDSAFSRATMTDLTGSTRGDVDLGAMLAAGRVRAGLALRNATRPVFGEEGPGGAAAALKRHLRGGLAWGDRWPGQALTIVAVDADFTAVPSATGDRREVSAGAERWLLTRRVGVRGGVRASTIGGARPVLSAGGSYAVRSGLYADAYLLRGRADERGWGVGVRVSY